MSPDFQRRQIADTRVDKLIERMLHEGVRLMLVDTDPSVSSTRSEKSNFSESSYRFCSSQRGNCTGESEQELKENLLDLC